MSASDSSGPGDGPFGRAAVAAPDGVLWQKWRALEAHIAADSATLERCRTDPAQASPGASQFLALVERALAQEGLGRIDVVNRGVNMSIRFASDLENRGLTDQWSGPLETFAAGCGDCEDFAAAKYTALRMAGTAEGDLRMVLGFDTTIDGHHMMLAARDDERWVILDNRNPLLLEDRQHASFVPLFLFGASGVQQFGRVASRGTFSLAERLGGSAARG